MKKITNIQEISEQLNSNDFTTLEIDGIIGVGQVADIEKIAYDLNIGYQYVNFHNFDSPENLTGLPLFGEGGTIASWSTPSLFANNKKVSNNGSLKTILVIDDYSDKMPIMIKELVEELIDNRQIKEHRISDSTLIVVRNAPFLSSDFRV